MQVMELPLVLMTIDFLSVSCFKAINPQQILFKCLSSTKEHAIKSFPNLAIICTDQMTRNPRNSD